VAFVAAVTGDNIGFAIGHFGGRALALRFGKYVFLTEERLDKAERFFDRRGSIVITFARFVEGLRQANGIIAGITGMHWLRFVIFNAIGAALWVGTWITIGYFAGNNITTIYHYITLYSYYVLAGLVVLIVGYIVWRRRRRRRAAAAAASQTEEAPEDSSASEAAEPSPDQHGPAHAVPDEQETEQIAPTEHVAGPPSVPDRHAPEQPSRRQGS
jgi:membrane protein DedA with SNARE-associated domain